MTVLTEHFCKYLAEMVRVLKQLFVCLTWPWLYQAGLDIGDQYIKSYFQLNFSEHRRLLHWVEAITDTQAYNSFLFVFCFVKEECFTLLIF